MFVELVLGAEYWTGGLSSYLGTVPFQAGASKSRTFCQLSIDSWNLEAGDRLEWRGEDYKVIKVRRPPCANIRWPKQMTLACNMTFSLSGLGLQFQANLAVNIASLKNKTKHWCL